MVRLKYEAFATVTSMALSGNFFAKFSQDLELIYAKYSRSFDGSAEFSLKVCDLPENVKQIKKVLLENIRSPKHEQWQVVSNHDSSSQDSCLANSLYSSDENHGFMSYHKDEESGHVFTTPVGSSDEETSSSPYYESNDILGWESGCSESEEATNPMANNKSPDLFVEKSNKPAKTFPSPSKTVSLKRRPNKDRHNSSSHDTGGAIPSNIYNKTSPSSYDSRLVACTQTREHRRKPSARNTPNEDKSSDLRMGINVGSALRECPCEEMCSTLLTAVHKFQNLVSNVLLLSRDNQKHSQDLAIPSAVSDKENDETCFKKISQCLHGKQKFLDDLEREPCIDFKSRKSLDFQQPMCVVEKIFARPKGSAEDSFMEVASRQFLNNNTEIRCSADENDNLRHACSGLLSAPTITKLGKNKGRVRSAIYNTNQSPLLTEASLDEGVSSPGVNGGDSFRDAKRYSTWSRSTPHRDSPVENSGSEPDHNVRSLRHGQKNALDPRLGSPRAILPLQNDWGVSLGYEKYNANDVKRWRTIRNEVPTINGVISLDIKTTRETQCCTPLQGSPSSEDTNERPKSLSNRSPLLTRCQDGGMISPGVESCGTGRRSVPLRATPGCDNVMRTSDHMTLGLLHQTSTPDDKRADWRADERKVETNLSSDPKTFFKQRKIPQPRRSLMAPGNLTPGDSTPSPIRPLSSSQRDQSADKSSVCTLETREHARPTGTHDDHVGDSRRRLYSPRLGQTSQVTQRAQATAPLPVIETGGRKTAPRTPQGPRLAGKHFDRFSSNDENPRSPHSLKIKSTPRRNSTGCHPYARYSPSSRRESPSLASPLQALRILSPSSSCDETARWSTLRHSTGKRPIVTYEKRSEKPGLLFKKEKRLKKKTNFDHTEECEVTHDCSQGNCTKKFCFNCSMDYS